MDCPFDEETFSKGKVEELTQSLYEESIRSYTIKMDRIAQTAYPVIKGVYEDANSNYENIGRAIYRWNQSHAGSH